MATTALANAPKEPHPGERLASYFDNFFKTIIGISTFGASLTFTKIVQNPVTPWISYGYSSISVQRFLGFAFFFFVLDLAITSFAASALSLWRPQAVEWFGREDSSHRRVVMWWATLVSSVLFGMLLAAFLFVGLVLVAYTGPTGWTTIGFTVLFGVLGFGAIVWQSPIGSRPPEHARPESWSTASEKLDRHSSGPRYTGDDDEFKDGGRGNGYFYKDGPTVTVEDQYGYGDDGLSRRGTLVRPLSVAVPDYTSDLRRYRAIKASGDYSNYDGRE
jgi:hypothetical protein